AEAQRALAKHNWPQGVSVRVRMGLHTGEPWTAEEGYVGMDVHRAARIAHIGHGGQVLLSETTAALVVGDLPKDVSLLDLGRHRLKDMQRPEQIRQLVIKGLPAEFPLLKSLEALGPDISAQEPVRLPAFLDEGAVEKPVPVFVGRERELEQLFDQLGRVLEGQGGIFFLAGNAGSGKTALLNAFSRKAQEIEADLLVALGNCDAFSGRGDPYLPFRDVLRSLAGDVKTGWAAGAITTEGARRLWEAMPLMAHILADHGPELVDTFVRGSGLISRLSKATPAGSPLMGWLQTVIERKKPVPDDLEQTQLFEQVVDVLHHLAQEHPLLVLLDDLQWADGGSINLLFHLGRRLAGTRILLVGAYRPEEVALGRDANRHPLALVLDEFKRSYGQVWVDLNESEAERFLNELLDSDSNRLGPAFRQKMLQQTGGHALFTVELLRDMQEAGDLVRDEEGLWITNPSLSWEKLPVRVEGVISSRIGRLDEGLREILTVAAVEGEEFTAQVIAQVHGLQEGPLLRTFSRDLERRHHLVKEGQALQIDGRLLSRYRFTHSMFQRYLYHELSAGERRLLHGQIAPILEKLYAGRLEQITVKLARHYEVAGETKKAARYYLSAGDRSRALYAHQEAIAHYLRAIPLLEEGGDYERAAQTQMKLGLTYHLLSDFRQARRAYDKGFTLWQQAGLTRPAAPLPPAPHALRVDLPGQLILDPAMTNSYHYLRVFENIFSGLAKHSPEMNVVPDVARSWELLADGRKYIFYLREDVQWTDGQPVTAYDFAYAWKRALNPATNSDVAPLLYDIKWARAFHQGKLSDPDLVCVKALDPFTLEVELEGPRVYFPHLVALHSALPVPRHLVELYGDDWAKPENLATNGPFQLAAPQVGEPVTLIRNPTYHGRWDGNVERVELCMPADRDQLLVDYRTDRLDMLNLFMLPDHYWATALQQFAADYLSLPAPVTHFVALDTRRSPFDDRRVRRALALAFDPEYQEDRMGSNVNFPATGGFLPPGMPGHSEGIGLPFDVEQAREILAAAGYPGGQGLPILETPVAEEYAPAMQAVCDQWLDNLGIVAGIRVVAPEIFYAREYDRPPHIMVTSWTADYPDPDNFLRVGAICLNLWKNERFEGLVQEAQRTTDHELRMQMYRQADQILIDEAAIIPIGYSNMPVLIKPWLKLRRPSLGVLNRWQNLIIEPH
ncbi:MAG TPA: BREX system ATP-binding domain-containing protein, partial [candidate division Zixibacteria bacterium]|nr:BREX system ATP-binding domain-containing protein [candidate division Zixibacteria bacterium]